MLTRKQKEEIVKNESAKLSEHESLVIADFTGLSVNKVNAFRRSLEEIGASFKVIKKRLLNIVFREKGIELDTRNMDGQTGVVFSGKDMAETAKLVYKFQKENKEKFRILGGVELAEKKALGGREVEMIGKLPSRDVLLGQLVYMIGSPIRSFMVVLSERGKKIT